MKYKMINGYFYPNSKIKATTPYFDFFMDYLKDKVFFVNRDSKSGIGILNIFKYILKIDVAFLNFPEDIVDKRYGCFQVILFVFVIVPFFKMSGKKIVWTMHNSKSHYSENQRIKKFLFTFLMKRSDLIVVHAKDGEKIISDINKKYILKVFYFPHPVKDMGIKLSNKKPKYDIIIWGTITPYKGIDSFLEYLHENSLQNKYKILIAGKIKTPSLETKIKNYLTNNIKLVNRFVSDEELVEFISQSKIILFPYNHDSVLASGALVYSLNFRKPIIGPHIGAFKDLASENLLYTFKSYDDIERIDISTFDINKFDDYVNEVSWEMYTSHLMKRVEELL